MKRCLAILLTLLLLTLAACADMPATLEAPPAPEPEPAPVVEPPPPPEPFPGKIAIITNTIDNYEEEYRSAQQVAEKYGQDKIVHVTWPIGSMAEQEQIIKIVMETAADPEIKALVINQTYLGANDALTKLRETREDIFVVYCAPQETPQDVVKLANLVLCPDEPGMGTAMVRQAHKMGAKTFVYYFFRRGSSRPLRTFNDLMAEECAKLEIELFYVPTPNPTSNVDVADAQQFILEDVPKQVAQYGADTAFFSPRCTLQIPLIWAVADAGAIYPQPCHPSPYHGFPLALGIETPEEGMATPDYMIAETARLLGDKGVLGRFSTCPVPLSMLQTHAGVEYAIKWLNGEVPKEGIDVDVLKQCMEDYAGVECFAGIYTEKGVEYPNFLLLREDYITFGEEYIK